MCFDNLLYDFEYVQINPILAVGHVDCHTIYRYFDCHLGLLVDYRMKLATKAKGVTELAFYQKRKRIMVPLPV